MQAFSRSRGYVLVAPRGSDAGTLGILIADRARNLMRHTALETIRRMTTQQFIKHNAERVHVSRGRH
jgi:hypothetical protein